MNNFLCINKNVGLEYFGSLFIMISFFILYISPFWWPMSNANAVALIRVFIFLSTVIFVTSYFVGLSEFRANFNFSIFLLLLFLTYLIFNSYFLSIDSQPIRRVILLLSFFIAIYFLDLNPVFTRLFLISLGVAGFCFAMYSLVSMYSINGLPAGYRKGGLMQSANQDIAYFGNTIVAAMHYSITFSILVFLFLTETKKVLLFLWLTFLGVVSAYLALTFSRAGWVACAIVLSSIFYFTFDKNKIRFYLVLICVLSIFAYFLYNFLGYELFDRGLTHRDEIWAVIFSRMHGNWLFGYGLSTPFEPIPVLNGKVFVGNSHNVYLEILYQTGLIGLILFVSVAFNSLCLLYKYIKKSICNDVAILFFSVLLSVLVVMFIDLNSWISTPDLLWQWLWVPIAFSVSITGRFTTHEKAFFHES